MRKKGFTIFWPQYFDKSRSSRLGRRVSLEEAIEKPSLQDITAAAQKLKYNFEINPTSLYPRTTWDDPGMVLIDIMGQKKSFVLKRLAPEIKIAKALRMEQNKLKKTKGKKKKKKIQNQELLKKKIAQRKSNKK